MEEKASGSSGESNRQDSTSLEPSVTPDALGQHSSTRDQPSTQEDSISQTANRVHASVAKKEETWSEDKQNKRFADGLDKLLWDRVLKARLKVMQDYISLKTQSDSKDESMRQRLESQLDEDLKEQCRAADVFQMMRNFHQKSKGISRSEDKKLFHVAALRVAADEFERDADVADNDIIRNLIREERKELEDSMQGPLHRLRWLDLGGKISDYQQIAQNWNRYLVGFVGGFALLIPMTIMVLHPSRLTSLVTTIISVLIVAGALCIPSLQVEPKDVFAGVAGYSAVLVVFVGASTTTATVTRTDEIVAGGLLAIIVVILGIWSVYTKIHYSRMRHKKDKVKVGEP